MYTCNICLKEFKNIRFKSTRISVCGWCANDLNQYREVAEGAYSSARNLLRSGMIRRATNDLNSPHSPDWKRFKAAHILENIENEVDSALSKWINKLVADKSNNTKIFKIIRAHRRGLLHFDRPKQWGHPNDWEDVAHRIRVFDEFKCNLCSASEVELHVHHIVYVSNFGTHQKTNLITLCRFCHEKEHKRNFDFSEIPIKNKEFRPGQTKVDTDFLSRGMGFAAFYFETGTRCFTKYTELMIENFGDDIKPYLLMFWESLRSYPGLNKDGMTDPAESARRFNKLTQ